MGTRFRNYKPEDFLPIRDFLVANYKAFKHPVNWDLMRWNVSRYLNAPHFGAKGLGRRSRKVPDVSGKRSIKAICFWESSIGVWETEGGEIAGVVCPDVNVPWVPFSGDAFLQRHPDYEHLLPEMLAYAEKTIVRKGTRNTTRIYVGEPDITLQQAAKARGFVKDETPCEYYHNRDEYYLKFDLSNLPEPNLPQGYRFVSMAENNDLEKHRRLFGLKVRHPDPDDWPILFACQELQKAPDYRKDLDLVVEKPDREWVACAIGWLDKVNRTCTLELVGSIQLGMGREVVMEALRRMKALGADTAYMCSGLKYYQVIGFKKQFPIYPWIKKH